MTDKINPRKAVAAELKVLVSMLDPAKYAVAPDPTNPYARGVAHGGKSFRVIVKELA